VDAVPTYCARLLLAPALDAVPVGNGVGSLGGIGHWNGVDRAFCLRGLRSFAEFCLWEWELVVDDLFHK
jgi:hypothetical protein